MPQIILRESGSQTSSLDSCSRRQGSVLKYDVALKTDKFLLVVHGTAGDVNKAKEIIAGTEHSFYAIHGETVYA